MRILIIEDEPPIARYIERSCRLLLESSAPDVSCVHTIEEARKFLARNRIDLCLLDLNLSGEDGFGILAEFSAMPFLCIVISAHGERAVQAFEYGVVDFVPKPFNKERLRKAFDRFLSRQDRPSPLKNLVYRLGQKNRLLPVDEIVYFRAARVFVEAVTTDGRKILLEKHLNQLERILPPPFLRIHRSFLVNTRFARHYQHLGMARYQLGLKDGTLLPVSRHRYASLKRWLQ